MPPLGVTDYSRTGPRRLVGFGSKELEHSDAESGRITPPANPAIAGGAQLHSRRRSTGSDSPFAGAPASSTAPPPRNHSPQLEGSQEEGSSPAHRHRRKSSGSASASAEEGGDDAEQHRGTSEHKGHQSPPRKRSMNRSMSESLHLADESFMAPLPPLPTHLLQEMYSWARKKASRHSLVRKGLALNVQLRRDAAAAGGGGGGTPLQAVFKRPNCILHRVMAFLPYSPVPKVALLSKAVYTSYRRGAVWKVLARSSARDRSAVTRRMTWLHLLSLPKHSLSAEASPAFPHGAKEASPGSPSPPAAKADADASTPWYTGLRKLYSCFVQAATACRNANTLADEWNRKQKQLTELRLRQAGMLQGVSAYPVGGCWELY